MSLPEWHGPKQCASAINIWGFPRAHRCIRIASHKGRHHCDGFDCGREWTDAEAHCEDANAGFGDRLWSQAVRFRAVWVAARLVAAAHRERLSRRRPGAR